MVHAEQGSPACKTGKQEDEIQTQLDIQSPNVQNSVSAYIFYETATRELLLPWFIFLFL